MHSVYLPLALTLFACVVLPAQKEADSADAVLLLARQAAGGNAWTSVGELATQGEFHAGSAVGSLHYFEDCKTGRNVLYYHFSGGVAGGQGTDFRGSWQQDSSGYITVSDDEDSERDAVDDRYLTQRAYWRPDLGGAQVAQLTPSSDSGQTFDRVQIVPRGGRGFTLWIDRSTHLIARVEHKGQTPSTEFWSEYREILLDERGSETIRVPFKISVNDGAQQFLYSSRKASSTASDADFQIPYQRNYSLPTVGKALVPFSSSEGVILEARINNEGPFAVILDTGASVNLMSADLAKRLELPLQEESSLAGMSANKGVRKTSVQSIRIGELTLTGQTFQVLELPYSLSHSWKQPVVAAIGYPAFRQLAIKIDYGRKRVTFLDGSTFRYTGDGTELPMHVRDDWFVVRGAVQDIPATFSLDTGQSNVSLTLYKSFVEQSAEKKLVGHFCGVSGESFGGVEHACFTRADVKLGTTQTNGVVTQLLQDDVGIAAEKDISGNLGDGFFRRFSVTFDAIHQKLFLETNTSIASQDVFNRAGLILQAVPQGYKVLNVFAGGPAATAGIENGDILTSIDDHAASEMDAATVEQLFREPIGTVVRLVILHTGSSKKLSLALKQIL